MAVTTTIKTHLTAQQVKDVLKDLPAILAGKRADRFGLRNAFFGAIAHHLFTKIHQSYIQKAAGGTDEFGDGWLPLAPLTIKKRNTPKVVSKYPLSAQNLILRVSDKLLRTLEPGDFDGIKYKPRRNQHFHHAYGKLTIGSKLDYSSFAHEKRPLWPAYMDPWIEESMQLAMAAVAKRLKEVLH